MCEKSNQERDREKGRGMKVGGSNSLILVSNLE